jgi:hypothetical protein
VQQLIELMGRSQTESWTEQMAQTWIEAQVSVDEVLTDLGDLSVHRWTRLLREAANGGLGSEDPTFRPEFRRDLFTFYMSAHADLVPPMPPQRKAGLQRKAGRLGLSLE